MWTDGAGRRLSSTGGRYFVDADRDLPPPIHTESAFCGRPVPGRGFCPQTGGILWTQTEICPRLSTQRVPFVDGRCRRKAFVHRRAVFCGRAQRIAPAYPHRGYLLWTVCAVRRPLSTGGRYFRLYFPEIEKLHIFAPAGRPIAQEIGRKVRAGQSTALWKAQIGDEFMQG